MRTGEVNRNTSYNRVIGRMLWRFNTLLICSMLAAMAADEKKLAIEDIHLAQSDDGIAIPADTRFLPGEVVYFSCHVSGYAKTGEDAQSLLLSYRIEATDPKGVAILSAETGKIANELAPEDKRWRPKIRYSIPLPPLADSGRYQVQISVKDELAKTEAQATVALVVEGREVAPSETLVVRNFRFLRTEEDKNPLQVAAYRPGDTLWARFDMTGYKTGDGNRYDIEYGLKVLRPTGETTYDQPRAAAEKNEGFYRQRYLPGTLSLTIPKDMRKGEYTIVLLLRDHIGTHTFEDRHKFTVE